MKTISVGVDTRRMLKLFTNGRSYSGVIEDALDILLKEGYPETTIIDRLDDKDRTNVNISVSENAWNFIRRLIIETEHKNIDDFVFEVVCNYALYKGLDVDCIETIVNMEF
jgi:hypothetical protein